MMKKTPDQSPQRLENSGTFSRRAALVALLATTTGCGGSYLRPEMPKIDLNETANPLTVDWTGKDRGDLEIATKQNKLVIVSYDGKTLRMLPECKGESSYEFIRTATDERVVQIRNEDDLKVNLPLNGTGLGAKLGGEFGSKTSLEIALASIGRILTTRDSVSTDVLRGNCEGATHFVKEVTVGAFAMQTGTMGKAKATAEIFAEVSAGSSSEETVSRKGGSLDACRKVADGISSPPNNCRTPLQLHLKPIDGVKRAVKGCPDGFVLIPEGICTTNKALPHQCEEGNMQDCRNQCAAGNQRSCNSYGEMLFKSRNPEVQTMKGLFERACNMDVDEACANLGRLYSQGLGVEKDPGEAATLFEDACKVGVAEGCKGLGDLHRKGEGVEQSDQEALRFYKKACEASHPEACFNVGEFYKEGKGGVLRSRSEARKFYRKACDGRFQKACDAL